MISESENIVLSSYAADEVSRNIATKIPAVIQSSQGKEAEKQEDSVKVSISKEAADMLEKIEGESVAVSATESNDNTKGKKDNAQEDSANSDNNDAPPSRMGAVKSKPKNKEDKNAKGEGDEEEELAPGELTPAEEDLVKRLEARDKEVKAHEQRHMAEAGELAVGGIHYTYQRGPDGKMYAIGGSVKVDSGSEADPEATARKARKLRSTALAAADASAVDASVAAKAVTLERNAAAQQSIENLDMEKMEFLASKIQNVYNPQEPESAGQRINIES